MGCINFTWIVVQPQGVIYVLAEGFEDVETAAATLETLTPTPQMRQLSRPPLYATRAYPPRAG